MPLSANRRRFLALIALVTAAPVGRALAQFSSAPPPPEGNLSGDDIKDFGSWRVVSLANQSHAFLHDERIRLAGAKVPGSFPEVGGSAKLEMEYWSVPGDGHGLKARLTTFQNGPPSMSGYTTRIVADGREVATFETDGSAVSDLGVWFGADLAGFAAVKNLQVFMDVNGTDLLVYDVDLDGTADAIAAMPLIPDYNYNVRGLGRPSDNAPPAATGGGSSGACFLTTACCGVVGLADDCAELAALRAFRDGVMLATPAGRADVARYYEIAPVVLAEMRRRGEERTLLRLYFTAILPAVAATRLGLNGVARGLYTGMMLRLERRYIPG